jgi:choline dehydrogenase-like flavoprotein
MFIDARTLPEGTTVQADVCIVGAGAAGIALARELRGGPFRVCLLESGNLEFNDETQSLYKGELAGQLYMPLTTARQRFFGGTTNHWGGWCQPLDDIDFEARDWVPHSGWPFGKSHLRPFYERAQAILEIGPFAYDSEDWDAGSARHLPFRDGRVITRMVQFSPPTRFGQVYRDAIGGTDTISTYLNANVTEIETNGDGRLATRLHVACLQGNRFSVSARIFILAAGGIENARLLLMSNKVQKAGLGNHHDLVGRYFMDHAGLKGGTILLADPNTSTALYVHRVRGFHKKSPPTQRKEQSLMGELMLTPTAMRAERLANFSAVLESTSSLESAKGDGFLTPLYDVIKNVNRRFFKPPLIMRNIIEPIPNPESRVSLIDERDRLGQNLVRLDWRLSSQDKHTIKRSQEIIGAELGRAGLGRLMVFDEAVWPASLERGLAHHMGTTRMHIDPIKGVVNENCRVHGIANLFVAGSSVFPTYGYAPPTLTIIALALRLADHVRTLLKNTASVTYN